MSDDRNRGRAIAMRGLGGYSVSPSIAPTLRGIPASLQETDMAANAALHNTVSDINSAGAVGTVINTMTALNAPVVLSTPTVPAPGAVNTSSSTRVSDTFRAPDPNVAAVKGLKAWQYRSPGVDAVLRVGLPILGYVLWRDGNHIGGGAAFTAAAGLWANKMGVIHV